ncbi:hypothetical protein C8R44DRAFT_762630 [Mycena epipterygia]|nr:hypothetical protein C8R44DRAFT_762630 [Mycena epipterygia]
MAYNSPNDYPYALHLYKNIPGPRGHRRPLSSRDVPDLRTIVMPFTICTSRQHHRASCPAPA